MSTKSTIRFGKNWHFYHEAFDREHLYLELEATPFEASPDRVVVAIPVPIWEVIRQHEEARFDLLDASSEELREKAAVAVAERVERVRAERERTGKPGISDLLGIATYGAVDDPVEEQIERGYRHLLEEQRRQRAVKRAIEELQAENALLSGSG